MSEDFMKTAVKIIFVLGIAFLFNYRGIRDKYADMFGFNEPFIHTSYKPIEPIKPISGTSSGVSSPSFGSSVKYNYDKNAKCPTASGKTTFVGVDKGNNGIIASTDQCIICKKSYYTHD